LYRLRIIVIGDDGSRQITLTFGTIFLRRCWEIEFTWWKLLNLCFRVCNTITFKACLQLCCYQLSLRTTVLLTGCLVTTQHLSRAILFWVNCSCLIVATGTLVHRR
jgi:hypothetical protein